MIEELQEDITPEIENRDQSSFQFMDNIQISTKLYRVGIIGATGLVGRTLQFVLKNRHFPIRELHIFGSDKSEGNWHETPYGTIVIEKLTTRKLPDLDFLFIAARPEVAKKAAFRFARRGTIVIDKSSYFRNKRYVPLVIPEVNPECIVSNRGIIASPNCTTIPVVSALAPLNKAFVLRGFTAVSFQSVSGYGKDGLQALCDEELQKDLAPSVFPHRISDNLIPWIGSSSTRISGEESKMILESRKILRIKRLPIRCTSVRVPVPVSHGVAIHADFKKGLNLDRVHSILESTPGLELLDDPQNDCYPTPLAASGKDEVFVGRCRIDRGRRGLALWVVTDNLRKGAAVNAAQIAELIIEKQMIR